ncbi:MAG: hypothetical protein ACJ0BH_00375 [Candidatus Puniceispirillaceae bacterium]
MICDNPAFAPNQFLSICYRGFIDALERAGIPASEYRFHLYKTLSVPLLMIGIAMLAARVTLTNVSRGRRSRLFLRGAFLAIVIFHL